MCGTILKLIFGLLAVVFAFLGLFIITFRFQALNPELYKTAFENAGLYETAREQVDKFLLPDPEAEETRGAYVFLDPILNKLDIEEVLRTTVNNNIDNVFAWINDPNQELFIYFPRTTLIESFNFDEVEASFLKAFQQEIKNLPECTEQQLLELQNTETEQVEGFRVPECRPPGEFGELLNAQQEELSKEVQKLFGGENPIVAGLDEAGFGHLREKTPISEVLGAQDGDTEATLEALNNIKTIVFYTSFAGFLAIGISLILTIIIIMISKLTNRAVVGTFATIYIFVGFLLLIIGFASRSLPDAALNLIPQEGMTSAPEAEQFMKIGESVIREIVPNLFKVTLITGIAIFIISVILGIIALLLPKSQETKEIPKTASQA